MPRAFSILELMIALAIVVALASVVLPSLGARLADEELRSACDRIESELAQVRQRAIAESRAVGVEASTRDGAWRVREFDASDPESPRVTRLEIPRGFEFRLASEESAPDPQTEPAEVGAGEDGETIAIATFLGDGSAGGRADIELVRGGEAYRLMIGRWSSVARFEPVADAEPPEDEAPVSDEPFTSPTAGPGEGE